MPIATTSPISLSSIDITAKPIIWAQHPAKAAPAAKPLSPNITPIAALDIGAVKAIPIKTATTIDMKNGCMFTPWLIKSPIQTINLVIYGPINIVTIPATIIEVKGTNKISTGVFPCTNLVTSTAIITATNAAIGFPVVAVLPLNVPAPIVPAITAAIRFNPLASIA